MSAVKVVPWWKNYDEVWFYESLWMALWGMWPGGLEHDVEFLKLTRQLNWCHDIASYSSKSWIHPMKGDVAG